METATYRLSEYRISEHENGLLEWETHYGFGAQQYGMCFIHNDILIIGPCSHEEVGYLKGEFLDRIEKLPFWNKTKSYCFASELLDVASGRSLNNDFLDRMFYSGTIANSRETPIVNRGPGAFRLDKYLITVAADGQISWQAHARENRVIGGQCTVRSGVLFIGPEEQENEKQTKKDFFRKLTTVPRWDGTKIWSTGLVLRPCQAQPERGRSKASRGKAESRGIHAFFEEPAAKRVQRPRGQFRVFSGFSFCSRKPLWNRIHVPRGPKLRKPSWPLSREGISWFKWLVPAADLISGFISRLLPAKERSHLFRSSDRHRRK